MRVMGHDPVLKYTLSYIHKEIKHMFETQWNAGLAIPDTLLLSSSSFAYGIIVRPTKTHSLFESCKFAKVQGQKTSLDI